MKYYDNEDADVEIVESIEKGEKDVPLGPTNYSRLGPPAVGQGVATAAAPAPSVAIRDPEVLASLVEQLQQRRAEIAKNSEQIPTLSSNGAKAVEEAGAVTATAAAAKTSNDQKTRKNPRRGALQSAIGPMLRMLRNSEDL